LATEIDGIPLSLGRIIVEIEVLACNENHEASQFNHHIGFE